MRRAVFGSPAREGLAPQLFGVTDVHRFEDTSVQITSYAELINTGISRRSMETDPNRSLMRAYRTGILGAACLWAYRAIRTTGAVASRRRVRPRSKTRLRPTQPSGGIPRYPKRRRANLKPVARRRRTCATTPTFIRSRPRRAHPAKRWTGAPPTPTSSANTPPSSGCAAK
jgi:hypothetical protein